MATRPSKFPIRLGTASRRPLFHPLRMTRALARTRATPLRKGAPGLGWDSISPFLDRRGWWGYPPEHRLCDPFCQAAGRRV